MRSRQVDDEATTRYVEVEERRGDIEAGQRHDSGKLTESFGKKVRPHGLSNKVGSATMTHFEARIVWIIAGKSRHSTAGVIERRISVNAFRLLRLWGHVLSKVSELGQKSPGALP
jgi:hypothetical protein